MTGLAVLHLQLGHHQRSTDTLDLLDEEHLERLAGLVIELRPQRDVVLLADPGAHLAIGVFLVGLAVDDVAQRLADLLVGLLDVRRLLQVAPLHVGVAEVAAHELGLLLPARDALGHLERRQKHVLVVGSVPVLHEQEGRACHVRGGEEAHQRTGQPLDLARLGIERALARLAALVAQDHHDLHVRALGAEDHVIQRLLDDLVWARVLGVGRRRGANRQGQEQTQGCRRGSRHHGTRC